MTSVDSIDDSATAFGYSGERTVESPDPYGFGSDSVPISNAVFSSDDGPLLPPPNEMLEEGLALREWRRQNAIRLEENENREKETRNQIIDEGEEFKKAFYENRKLSIEANKTNNREKENLYLTNQEKFHKEADKQYWKSIAELVPNEVRNIEKKGRKKDQENKPAITVVQGPKPGKPTDLSRMRHVLVKLKHKPPPHMLPPTPKDGEAGNDSKGEKDVKSSKDGDAPATNDSSVTQTSEAAAATVNDQHAT